MIIIIGSATVRSDHRAEALALGIEHSARSRAEPGCIAHNCHVDAEDPNRSVFVEQWADLAAVKAHFAVPASGEFVRDLMALGKGAQKMRIYHAQDVTATVRE